MPMSPYYAALRAAVGHRRLLIPAVAAVIHDEAGRVLIQHRADGGVSLPAGAIEPGETPAEAVTREVFEETGLTIRPRCILGVFGGPGFSVVYANGDLVDYTVVLFGCDVVASAAGEGAIDAETASLRFYEPAAVPPLGTEYPRSLLMRDAPGLRL